MIDKYYESKRFLKILKAYEDFIERKTNCYLDADELTDIAEYYHSLGRQGDATDAADLALRLYPGATAPLSFLARSAILIDGDRNKAEEFVERIYDKSDIEYIYTKAEIMVADNQAQEADDFLCAYAKSSQYDETEDSEQDFFLDVACIFIDYFQYELCEKWLKKCTQTDNTTYLELYGKVYCAKDEYVKAEKCYQTLVDREPYSGDYWNQLATIQLVLGKTHDAILSSEYAIAINPNDEDAIVNKANGLFALCNFDEALKYYKKYTILTPLNELGEMFQGITLASDNRFNEAITHFEAARDIATRNFHESNGVPDDLNSGNPNIRKNLIKIHLELAITYSLLRLREQALASVDDMELYERDKVSANILRGRILLECKDGERAQECFQKAMIESSGDSETVFRIAVSIYECGFIQVAYLMFEKLINYAEMTWTKGFGYMARCCFELGKMDDYNNVVALAVKINPTEAQSLLGDLYPDGTPPAEYPNLTPSVPQ